MALPKFQALAQRAHGQPFTSLRVSRPRGPSGLAQFTEDRYDAQDRSKYRSAGHRTRHDAATAQTNTEQRPSATTEVPKTPVSGQILSQDSNSLLAKDFIGLAVYSPDKLKIGTINDLILSKDGKTVEGFVIGVGGFLGIGEKAVA